MAIRIALISDIHFGQLSRTTDFAVPGESITDKNGGGKSLKDSLVDTLKEVNAKYLCIAGDLTSFGSPQEFVYCEKAILSVAEEANICQNRIIIGLGNHDIDWEISEIYNKYKNAPSDFPHDLVRQKYRKIAASASLTNIDTIPKPCTCGPAPFSGIIENEDFIMFVLNSGWCCTRDQAFSHGKLDEDQFEWFASSLINYDKDNRWKIVLMHHHPFNYTFPVPIVDISTLEEGSRFLDIMGEKGIHLVLHGHRHHPRAETFQKNGWPHPVTFICAGSLAVNSAHRSSGEIPNTLHIIELSQSPGVLTLYNYQYTSAEGWIPIRNNCPETPLDAEMMLGKLFNEEERNQAILNLTTIPDRELEWKDLDESLRFLAVNELNERIKKLLSRSHKIVGLFPKEVILIKQ